MTPAALQSCIAAIHVCLALLHKLPICTVQNALVQPYSLIAVDAQLSTDVFAGSAHEHHSTQLGQASCYALVVIICNCCTLYCHVAQYVLRSAMLMCPGNVGWLDAADAIPISAGSLTLCSTMGVCWMDAALHSGLPWPPAWPPCASWKLRGPSSSTRGAAAVLPTRLKHKL